MNEQTDKHERDLDGLRRRYREIEAPPYLATRIRAAAGDRAHRRTWWRPALAAIPAVVIAIVIVPLVLQQQPAGKPTLTSLPDVSSARPDLSSLSMARIRSVRTPALPRKPEVEKPEKPQSNFDYDDQEDRPEEKAHV